MPYCQLSPKTLLSAPHFGGGVILDVAAIRAFQLDSVVVERRGRREPDTIGTRRTVFGTIRR